MYFQCYNFNFRLVETGVQSHLRTEYVLPIQSFLESENTDSRHVSSPQSVK